MQKLLILLPFTFCILNFTFSQNVGIGTATPGAKLQINHRNTSASPALTLHDSAAGAGSRILFTKENGGNTFSIVSTNDVLAANSSLDFRTTLFSGIFLRGDRRVGINSTNPQAILHVGGGVKITDTLNVAGDMNINGRLKVNNNAGTAGQVLVSQGADNNPGWAAPSFPADERAWLKSNTTSLSPSTNFEDTIDLISSGVDYNTSSAIFNFDNNTIIINKAGLYRFQGVFSGSTAATSSVIRGSHHMFSVRMVDDNVSIQLGNDAILERDIAFNEKKIKFSIDRYISAGSIIWFTAEVTNISSGTSASVAGNGQSYFSFYLIAE